MGSSLGRLNSGPGLRYLVERYEGLGLGSVYSAGDRGVEDEGEYPGLDRKSVV